MRRDDYIYWTMGLPNDAELLQRLDIFCREMGGIDKASASRVLLAMGLKAWGGIPVTQQNILVEPAKETKAGSTKKPLERVHKAADAAIVDLDL